jgi:maleylpyruvate isomerase
MDEERTDRPHLRSDLTLAAAAHHRLLVDLDTLIDGDSLVPARPSRLPGWTVGHVLTHITQSGDGHARMFRGAAVGEVAAQYPDGLEGRNAAIEAGAVRPVAQQVAGLRASVGELERLWTISDFEGTGIAAAGARVDIADLPFLRIREVAIHHVDLGIGFEFADLPEEYVRRELRWMEMQWTARRPMGLTALPPPALELPPHERLAWLMGRREIDGLEPAGVF